MLVVAMSDEAEMNASFLMLHCGQSAVLSTPLIDHVDHTLVAWLALFILEIPRRSVAHKTQNEASQPPKVVVGNSSRSFES